MNNLSKNKSPILSNKQNKVGLKLSEKNIFDINTKKEIPKNISNYDISKNIPSNISEIDNINYSNDYPLEFIDLDSISLEYDIYISSLKKQLMEEMTKRKNNKIKRNSLKYKLTLLKEEEQINLRKLNYIKNQFNKKIQERTKISAKIQNKICHKTNLIKTKPKIKKLRSSSVSSMTKESSSRKSLKPNLSASNINDNSFLYLINNKIESNLNTIKTSKNFEKNRIKLLMLKKLEEDDKKRKNIEYEIQQIEKEEYELMQQINKDNFNNDKNNTIK